MNEGHGDEVLSSFPTTNSRARQALDAARTIVRRSYSRWSPEDQEDLASIAVVKYWRTFGTGNGPDNLEAWLTTVVRNAARDIADQRSRQPSDPVGDPAVDLRLPTGDIVSTWLRGVERFGPSKFAARDDLLVRVFSLINETDRQVIAWKYLHGQSARDIALALGTTVAAANQRIYRARRLLAAALNENPKLLGELRADMPRMY